MGVGTLIGDLDDVVRVFLPPPAEFLGTSVRPHPVGSWRPGPRDHALENRACERPHPDLETIRIWMRCPDEREEARTDPPRLAIPNTRSPVRSGRLTANISHSRRLRIDHRDPFFDASLWQSHSVVNPAIEPERDSGN